MPFRVDFTTPGFVRPAVDDPANMTDAQRFFYEHAGWGYHPDRETPEQGRVRGARRLAEAEAWAKREGLSWRWEEDEDAVDSEGEWADWPCYWAALRDADGEILASLGGVMFADKGDETSDPYARVVTAELALEVMPS